MFLEYVKSVNIGVTSYTACSTLLCDKFDVPLIARLREEENRGTTGQRHIVMIT